VIVAIDGPAAAGKGTLARRLADKFDFAYLDTGMLYRAVALILIKADIDPHDEAAAVNASETLDFSITNDPMLRVEGTGNAASIVAAMPEVRNNLLKMQRKFGFSPPNGKKSAILDGRDIGTVVCPDADVKFFVTATPEVRAERRTAEMQARGEPAVYAAILEDVRKRDARDMSRGQAPLKPAEDALLLDTTLLDIDAVFLRAVQIIEAKIRQRRT